MKKELAPCIFSALLAVATVGSACTRPPESQPPLSTTAAAVERLAQRGWNRHTIPNVVSIDVPATWTGALTSEVGGAFTSDEKQPGSLTPIAILKVAIVDAQTAKMVMGGLDLKGYVAQFRNILQQGNQGLISEFNEREIRLDGQPAIRLDYLLRGPGTQMRGYREGYFESRVFFVRGGNLWHIELQLDGGARSRMLPNYNKVLDSLRFR